MASIERRNETVLQWVVELVSILSLGVLELDQNERTLLVGITAERERLPAEGLLCGDTRRVSSLIFPMCRFLRVAMGESKAILGDGQQ